MTNSSCFPVHLFAVASYHDIQKYESQLIFTTNFSQAGKSQGNHLMSRTARVPPKKTNYTNHYLFNQQVKIKL